MVVVTLEDGAVFRREDGTAPNGVEERYSYLLLRSGALLIRVTRPGSSPGLRTTVDRIYGPAAWESVAGDGEIETY